MTAGTAWPMRLDGAQRLGRARGVSSPERTALGGSADVAGLRPPSGCTVFHEMRRHLTECR